MDKQDKRILELLSRNCRIPHTTIGKAVQLSKDTVRYRINNLEDQGYISQYTLFIDARKFGLTRYHLLVELDADREEKQQIYKQVQTHDYLMWMNTFIGRYDMQLILDAEDAFHLDTIIEEIVDLCNDKIKEYTMLTHIWDLEFTHLNPILELDTPFERRLDHSFSKLLAPKHFPVRRTFEQYSPSKSEADILRELADEPQRSLTDISEATGLDRQTVKKRIVSLIEKEVILSFAGIPNRSKMGFVTYYLLVRLRQDTPEAVMKQPFQRLSNIFYAGRMLGNYDMILYLNARNPKELNESIEKFTESLEGHILYYDLLVQDKVLFWRQFTDGIYRYLRKNT